MANDPTDQDVYYAIRSRNGGYDGLIKQEFKDGGLTIYHMSRHGWVENNDLVESLHDPDTRVVDETSASRIARDRFNHAV